MGIQSTPEDIYFYFGLDGSQDYSSPNILHFCESPKLIKSPIQHSLVLFALSFLAGKVKSPLLCAKYLTLIINSVHY